VTLHPFHTLTFLAFSNKSSNIHRISYFIDLYVMLFTDDFQLFVYLAYNSRKICVTYKLEEFIEKIDSILLKI
jgi:hypothetical protein